MILKTEGLKNKKWIRMFAVAMALTLAAAGAVTVNAAIAESAEGVEDSSVPINSSLLSSASTGTLVAEADELTLTPNQMEVLPTPEVYTYSKSGDIKPFATVTWPDTTIGYNTETRFISSASGGYFIIRSGITATFKFSIKEDSSENIRVAFKDKNGNTTVLFEGSASSKTVTYTPSKDVEGNFYVWNKAVADITLTGISLSY